MRKRIMVSGCFDLLHSGHVAFLKEAAQLGDLYVCIGSDLNVYQLKGRYPVKPAIGTAIHAGSPGLCA